MLPVVLIMLVIGGAIMGIMVTLGIIVTLFETRTARDHRRLKKQ